MSTAGILRPERGILDATPVPLRADGTTRERDGSAAHGPTSPDDRPERVDGPSGPEPTQPRAVPDARDGGVVDGATVRPTDGIDLDLDDSLMAAVQAGDEAAFERLVQRWQSRVLGYLTNMLGNRDDALDATQDTFVRLYTRADRHVPQGSFKAWLFRMATNVALDQLRRRKRRRWVSMAEDVLGRRRGDGADDTPLELAATASADGERGDGALGSLIEQERAASLHRALATLPAAYRSAVALKDLHDLGYEEAAGALGVSVGTVKSRVSRGRNLLREKLQTLLDASPTPPCRADAGRRTDG